MHAIIKTGGKQYIVTEEQKLRVEKLPETARKDGKVVFENVLAVWDDKKTHIGTPEVAKAKVSTTVVSDGKADKVMIVKYKAKVRYTRRRGHRQPFTELKIDSITV